MNFLPGQIFLALIWLIIKSTSAEISSNAQTNADQTLRISTTHFAPHMYQDEKGHFYSGMEFKLLQVIADRLNMSLSFQTTSKRSDICDNVAMNVSDICIGGIFPNKKTLKHTVMSVTYASDDLTWCVQKAGIMPMYLAHLYYINAETWFLLIFGYGYTSGIMLYLMIQFDRSYEQRNNRDWHYLTWLVALPACIGLSSCFRPASGNTRIFYAFMLISAFFFFQIMYTRSYDLLHKQIPWDQVSSFKEIIRQNFHLAGSPEAFNVLHRSTEISNHKMESFRICEDMSECLMQLFHSNKVAIAGSRQNILNSPLYSTSQVFCFRDLENIASYPVSMYMQRDFHLKHKINEIIDQLSEAGFFDKWNTDYYVRGTYELPYTIPLQLPITHISAALIYHIGAGSLLSTLTFILEKLIFWKMNQRLKHKVWIYLQQFVDGERHYFKNVPERLQEQNQYSEPDFPYLV